MESTKARLIETELNGGYQGLGSGEDEEMLVLGQFPEVCWNWPSKESRAERPRKEADNSRIKRIIKVTYGQKQSLG